jgi:hypothetical protein
MRAYGVKVNVPVQTNLSVKPHTNHGKQVVYFFKKKE